MQWAHCSIRMERLCTHGGRILCWKQSWVRPSQQSSFGGTHFVHQWAKIIRPNQFDLLECRFVVEDRYSWQWIYSVLDRLHKILGFHTSWLIIVQRKPKVSFLAARIPSRSSVLLVSWFQQVQCGTFVRDLSWLAWLRLWIRSPSLHWENLSAILREMCRYTLKELLKIQRSYFYYLYYYHFHNAIKQNIWGSHSSSNSKEILKMSLHWLFRHL